MFSLLLLCFQTYVKSQDKAFAAATIQAIGRCATNISEVTDTCLNGLVLLLSNRDGKIPEVIPGSSRDHRAALSVYDCRQLLPTRCPVTPFLSDILFAETVVAESVVVIKKLLQTQPTQHSDIIKHMAKLFDNISVRVRSLMHKSKDVNICTCCGTAAGDV